MHRTKGEPHLNWQRNKKLYAKEGLVCDSEIDIRSCRYPQTSAKVSCALCKQEHRWEQNRALQPQCPVLSRTRNVDRTKTRWHLLHVRKLEGGGEKKNLSLKILSFCLPTLSVFQKHSQGPIQPEIIWLVG